MENKSVNREIDTEVDEELSEIDEYKLDIKNMQDRIFEISGLGFSAREQMRIFEEKPELAMDIVSGYFDLIEKLCSI